MAKIRKKNEKEELSHQFLCFFHYSLAQKTIFLGTKARLGDRDSLIAVSRKAHLADHDRLSRSARQPIAVDKIACY